MIEDQINERLIPLTEPLFSKDIESDIFFDYEIKNLNWFNIGGNVKIFFKPKSLQDLIKFTIVIC